LRHCDACFEVEKADEVLLPYHPYSDRGESLRGNSQLLARKADDC
jgi:hypothetical protein